MPGSGVAEARSEWQGRVWSLPSPAGASKGQRLGMSQLFPDQWGFQKKPLLAISGWALTHPWLDARGSTAPAKAAPYPCPHLYLSHRPPGASGRPRQPARTDARSSLGCFHPTTGIMCVPRGCPEGAGPVGAGHCAPSHIPWQPRVECCAGFALGCASWGIGCLWGWAARDEPCWKWLMERWSRTEPVNTAGAPGSAAPFSYCLTGCLEPSLPALTG